MDRGLTQGIREGRLLRVALLILGAVILWRFFAGAATVALLLVFGVLLGVALSGPVEVLRRLKVPRALSAPLVVLGLLGIIVLVVYLFFPQFQGQSRQLSSLLPTAFDNLFGLINDFAGRFGINLSLGGQGHNFSFSEMRGFLQQVLGGFVGVFGTVVTFVAGVLAAIFLAVYLAASPDSVVNWIERLFPPERRPRAREIMVESRESLLSWLKGQLISMTIIGTLSGIALYVIGIPGAVILGLLTGLLEFVPYVGPIISVIPPAILGLLGHPIEALYVLVAYVVIQQVESNLVTPLVMRRAVEIHPAVVIAAVTLLGAVFGILGALLAVPATVVAGVLVKELWFRRLEKGTADRPAGAENELERT